MKTAIMQPTFNPWIGYFNLIDYVDNFVFLDTVQLTKRSWQTRNKLKINNNEYMFTIPILKEKKRDEALLKDVKISFSNFNFKEKLYLLLKQNYKKANHFELLESQLKSIIFFDTERLCDYNINFIIKISQLLSLKTNFSLSSSLNNLSGSKGDLILNIATMFSTDNYISPIGSKPYLDDVNHKFHAKQIEIQYQEYNHPEYKQVGKDFIPYLGILDLLLNEGIENTKKIIKSGEHFL